MPREADIHDGASENARVDSGLTRLQSSRQVGLIELGAATVIHNMHTQGSRASERANEQTNECGRESVGETAVTDAGRGWRRKGEVAPRFLSLSRGRRIAASLPRACNVCETWFSFDYRYGMHLRRIMHPRGGTFARSQAYPAVAIFYVARIAFYPFRATDTCYNHPSNAQQY